MTFFGSKQTGEPALGRLAHLQGVPEGHAAGLRPHDGADPHALGIVQDLAGNAYGIKITS